MDQYQTHAYAVARPSGGGPVPRSGFAALPYAERIRIVEVGDIAGWLRDGWRDFMAAPLASGTCGLMFVLIGLALTGGLWALEMLYLVTPLTAGFLIVGPALAVGIYEVSRRLERGEKPPLFATLLAFRRNSFHLLTAGLILMLFLMIWVRMAALDFALFFPYTSITLSGVTEALMTVDGVAFLAVGTAIGACFATVAFVFGAISLPLMLDHGVDIFTAAMVSALAVAANGKVMAVWAAIIVAVTGLALVAGYIGLIVVMPLMGHATWHAYRSLVDWERRI